jgi:predicted porin
MRLSSTGQATHAPHHPSGHDAKPGAIKLDKVLDDINATVSVDAKRDKLNKLAKELSGAQLGWLATSLGRSDMRQLARAVDSFSSAAVKADFYGVVPALPRAAQAKNGQAAPKGDTKAGGGEKPPVIVSGLFNVSATKVNGSIAPNSGTSGRLNISRNEPLSKDLSAKVQLETRFTPAKASDKEPFWNGPSFAELSSKELGTLKAGRTDTPVQAITEKFDLWGKGGSKMAAGYTGAPRSNNTIDYTSPKHPLTVQAAAGFGEDPFKSLGVRYGNDARGIDAAAGYAKQQSGNSLANVALKVGKTTAYCAQAEVGEATNKNCSVGTQIPVRAHDTFKARVNFEDPAGLHNNRKTLDLGYDLPLGERTKVYANVTNIGLGGEAKKGDAPIASVGFTQKF